MNNAVKVYHCPCGAGHFHLLTGTPTPSWPFWSLKVGLEMLEIAKVQFPLPADVAQFLEDELHRLASSQPRDKKGRFQKPLLRREDLGDIDMGSVACQWSALFSGESEVMNYTANWAGENGGPRIPGPFVVPLECHFVGRPEGERLEALTGPNAHRVYKARPRKVSEVVS